MEFVHPPSYFFQLNFGAGLRERREQRVCKLSFRTGISLLWMGLMMQASWTSPATAAEIPDPLKKAQITEHLGDSVLLERLNFKNERGESVELGSFFNQKKPVILVMAYYECPSLCTFVLNGLVDGLKKLNWIPGREFEIVTVSIDPTETSELAAKKKAAYLEMYGKPEAAEGWHFLVGEESSIQSLAKALGFGYEYNKEDDQYGHGAVLHILMPDGRISRYLYGIEYRPNDLKLALLEASNGKVGTVIDRFLMFCYRYDPKTRKYSVYLNQVMQLGGAVTVLVLGTYMAVFWRRQRRKKEEEPNSDAEGV